MNTQINRTLSTVPSIDLDPSIPVENLPVKPAIDPKYYQSTLSADPLNNTPEFLVVDEPERPQIDSPQSYTPSCSLLSALQCFARFEQLQGRDLGVFEEDLDYDLSEIKRLEEKHAALIREATKQDQSVSTWSTLTEMASYLASSFTLVAGVATMAAGGSVFAAAALIASAGLGIANQIIENTIGWDTVAQYFSTVKETQEKISQYASLGFTVVSMVLAAGGTMTQAAQVAQLIQNNVGKIFQSGLSLFSGAMHLGKSYEEGKQIRLSAEQVRHRQLVQAKRTEIQLKGENVGEEIRRLEAPGHQLGQMISQQQRLITK